MCSFLLLLQQIRPESFVSLDFLIDKIRKQVSQYPLAKIYYERIDISMCILVNLLAKHVLR